MGRPRPRFPCPQRLQYSALLLWYDQLLTKPRDMNGGEQAFTIEQGESANSVASHLEEVGLIRNAEAFRAYLIYSGLDTSIQSGEYKLSAAMSTIDIARKMQDATPEDVTFVILPGWRMEEIAASLPTSGLSISPDDFLNAARSAHPEYDFLAGANTTEGFLFPNSYIVPREVTADVLVNGFLRNFTLRLTPEIRKGFEQQGLTIYQAVTLASLVERESMKDEEQPMIASVYLKSPETGDETGCRPNGPICTGIQHPPEQLVDEPADPDRSAGQFTLQYLSQRGSSTHADRQPGPGCLTLDCLPGRVELLLLPCKV